MMLPGREGRGVGISESADTALMGSISRLFYLPAVTGDVIQQEDRLGLHLHGTVLLGDFVIQARGEGGEKRDS